MLLQDFDNWVPECFVTTGIMRETCQPADQQITETTLFSFSNINTESHFVLVPDSECGLRLYTTDSLVIYG